MEIFNYRFKFKTFLHEYWTFWPDWLISIQNLIFMHVSGSFFAFFDMLIEMSLCHDMMIEVCDDHLNLTMMAVMLSQPMPDMVSLATN